MTLLCGDALELLSGLPAASVDSVITDPPYLLGAASARVSADKPRAWASDIENASYWYSAWYREVWRILRPAGSFWTFCNWHSLAVVQCAAAKSAIRVTSVLVWDKQWPGVGSTRGLRQCYELIALMAKPAFAIRDRGVPDIWASKWSSARPSGHPAEKPSALAGRIMDVCDLGPGATVCDPFMGAASVGEACVERAISFIGIEREPDYYRLAEARIAAACRHASSINVEQTQEDTEPCSTRV